MSSRKKYKKPYEMYIYFQIFHNYFVGISVPCVVFFTENGSEIQQFPNFPAIFQGNFRSISPRNFWLNEEHP